MNRIDIINKIGREYLCENIENGEFSYAQVIDRKLTGHYKLDLRFYDKTTNTAVLIETKQKISRNKSNINQLFSYVELEKELSQKTNIVAVLASTTDDDIIAWKIAGGYEEELSDKKLKSFKEYVEYFKPQNVNDKTTVLENTSKLNRLLHDNGIPEKLRSQFVGTCLLALKNNLNYKGLNTSQIIAGIKDILGSLLEGSVDKADKIAILHKQVLQNQSVEKIKSDNFEKLLAYIEVNIVPYINESSNEGQDILSYFFTTFNKYVAREDKNQAFTPNHIAEFMANVAGIYRTSRILDPTCGSGTFLVQAMTQALKQCETDEERNAIKKEQIYGIEFDKNVYGLATTNMLIHGDGNSNIRCGSCFDLGDWIKKSDIDVVLMNPPYNASKNQVTDQFASTWSKTSTDPSKGFSFVEFIADKVGKGRLLTLLPMACAIQTNGVIGSFKRRMLEKHTLDAVFSFPTEMFYPGASAVACCMVFDLGKPHRSDKETFFGYFKEDGFEKRKGVGRVDVRNKWNATQDKWLNLYNHRSTVAGISVNHHVEASDEWCAEAYMETDYSSLSENDFQDTLNSYFAYLIKNWQYMRCLPDVAVNKIGCTTKNIPVLLNTETWKYYYLGDYFDVKLSKGDIKLVDVEAGLVPLISSGENNNGNVGYIDSYGDGIAEIFAENCITIDMFGNSFYQNIPFYAVSHGRVNILIPKCTFSKYIGLFLCSVIHKEQFKYSYGRAVYSNVARNIRILLPCKADGEPDWQFMENYIKSLPYGDRI